MRKKSIVLQKADIKEILPLSLGNALKIKLWRAKVKVTIEITIGPEQSQWPILH